MKPSLRNEIDQGQGGGVALEDAVALAIVLSPDSTPEEIPERLKLTKRFVTSELTLSKSFLVKLVQTL